MIPKKILDKICKYCNYTLKITDSGVVFMIPVGVDYFFKSRNLEDMCVDFLESIEDLEPNSEILEIIEAINEIKDNLPEDYEVDVEIVDHKYEEGKETNPTEDKILKLLNDNKDNESCLNTGYDKGYYEGYHDALVDVLIALDIPTSEQWFN